MDGMDLLVVMHVVGAAVGVEAATTSDALFLRSIRNRIISRDQLHLLRAASRVVLGALTLVVVTGIVLLFDDTQRLAQAYFAAKMTAVVVLLVNGLLFHTLILRFLARYRDQRLTDDVLDHRLMLFAGTGAISVVSWYGALILPLSQGAGLSYSALLLIYVILVLLGGIVAFAVLSYRLLVPHEAHEETAAEGRRHRRWGAIIIAVLLGVLVMALIVAAAR